MSDTDFKKLMGDMDALKEELRNSLAHYYGFVLYAVNAERGEFVLRDAFGPVAAVYSDMVHRVRGAIEKQTHILKCADAILKENQRLKQERDALRRFVAAAEDVVQFCRAEDCGE